MYDTGDRHPEDVRDHQRQVILANKGSNDGGESPVAADHRGASVRFDGNYRLVRFGVLRQQSAKLRRTTADGARSWSVAGVQHPPKLPVKKSLMLAEAAVKTALKKRLQTRGLRSNGGNP